MQTPGTAPLLAHVLAHPLAHPLAAAHWVAVSAGDPQRIAHLEQGCAWWDMACKGGHAIANAGLSAITGSIASGGEMLLGQIVKYIDSETAVPLADPTYRHLYYGFLGLAAPLVGVVLCLALVLACLRRDPGTLVRAGVGVGVAGLGGAFYIVLAQLLVAVDDWLAHGVVAVTGHNLTDSINRLAIGFHHVAGAPGEIAANMLLVLLMGIMLIAGVILWFVLVLRKVAILVVVAFAPLLIVGWLWAPTRAWVTRATEVLIALVFTKAAIFTLFGIGLAMLSRGAHQSLGDFVGSVVLMCGACFTPMLLLRLVHFAADSHLASDAISTLRGGVRPVTDRLSGRPGGTGRGGSSGPAMGRHDMANAQGQAPTPEPTGPDSPTLGPTADTGARTGAGATGAANGASGGAAGGAAGGAGAGAGIVAQIALEGTRQAGSAAAQGAQGLGDVTSNRPSVNGANGANGAGDPADPPLSGPAPPTGDHQPDPPAPPENQGDEQ